MFNFKKLNMSDEKGNKFELPFALQILESGIAGVRYEIIPLVLKTVKTQEELDMFAKNMMDCLDRYKMPTCGSAMWVLYKHYCEKDINTLLVCANTEKKRREIFYWMIKNFKG